MNTAFKKKIFLGEELLNMMENWGSKCMISNLFFNHDSHYTDK
jgi:hypothetical protein